MSLAQRNQFKYVRSRIFVLRLVYNVSDEENRNSTPREKQSNKLTSWLDKSAG